MYAGRWVVGWANNKLIIGLLLAVEWVAYQDQLVVICHIRYVLSVVSILSPLLSDDSCPPPRYNVREEPAVRYISMIGEHRQLVTDEPVEFKK